jgi:DNA-directed RNA polymerase specialized sigma subunit
MEDQEIQEIEQKKRWLKRYKKNLACIARLEDKKNLLDARIKTTKSPNISGMPRGGTPITLDEMIADKMELESRIKRLKAKKSVLKAEILEEIDSLDDPRYCEILEAFFIDCLSLDAIAEKENYTPRHVYRLYSEAIATLALKCH